MVKSSITLRKLLLQDLNVFRLVHPQKGLVKYFYFPDLRTVIIIRLCNWCFHRKVLKPLSYILTLINDLIAGVWVGPQVDIGPGLFLGHARGLVINPQTKIGKFCSIMQRVTIGGPNVEIGDFVEINAGACIVSNVRGRGRLSIGNHVIIGAGAVVIKDIPDCSVVVGVPAKVIKELRPSENWYEYRNKRNRESS